MGEFTKEEQAQAVYDLKVGYTLGHADIAMLKSMARQLLAGMEQEPVAWPNHCDSTIPAALRFLAEKPRPIYGNSPYNTEHLYQLAREIEAMTRRPLYAAPQLSQPAQEEIDSRMKAAGMLSAADILSGQPMDAFIKHAGVVDMASLLNWAEMRRGEFLRMQSRYELGDKEKDDLYEWVISHVAAFSELHVNIRAAMLQDNHRDLSHPVDPQVAEYEKIMERAMPDEWVAVPVDMAPEQIRAVQLNSELGAYAAANLAGAYSLFREFWNVAIAAAPQQEVKP